MSCKGKIKSIKKINCDSTPVYDISVRNNSNFILKDGSVVHNCKPYQYLRSTIYEERIEFYQSTLLKEELIGLERDNNSGKIDHSPSSINSKDSADAVCGSLYNASLHADEFSIEYGEDIDTLVSVASSSTNQTQEQITVDFENELKNLFRPQKTIPKQNSKDLDFGFGPSVPVSSGFISDGIMVW